MSVTISIFSDSEEVQVFEGLETLDTQNVDGLMWIDVESDHPEELQHLADEFGLHELAIEDCLDPGHFPKLEDYGNHLFMIFRALKGYSELETIWNSDEDLGEIARHDTYTRKVAIFLSHKYVITYRRREVPWLDAIIRQLKTNPQRLFETGTDGMAHRVIDVLVDRFMRGLNFFERIIDDFEEQAITATDELDINELLELKRDLTFLRQIKRDQRNVIYKLAHETSLIQETQQRRYFKDIDDHALTTLSILDKKIENILAIRDSYIAFSSVRLGDTMRILTVITTIAAPLHLVVGLYGMNFEVIPLIKNPDGFWIVVFLMLAVAFAMLIFFRTRRWI